MNRSPWTPVSSRLERRPGSIRRLLLVLAAVGSLTAMAATPVAAGSEIWEARYGVYRHGSLPTDMAVNADGTRLFVTGWSDDRINGEEFATVAYDAVTGHALWASRLDWMGSYAYGLALSRDGTKVFVTGDGAGCCSDSDYLTVAYDADTGTEVWRAEFDRALGNDIAYDIGVSPDGTRVFVTGLTSNGPTYGDYTTIAYDAATGTQLWVANYDGPASFDDQPVALQVAPDGSRVYVTGWSCGTDTGYDFATVAYDAGTGGQLWVARYAGPYPENSCFQLGDRPASLAVSPDGSAVYVTGESPGQYFYGDVTTIAYDASTGGQRWVERYSVPNPDSLSGGTSVGVSPDGSWVFVTGSAPTNGDDYVTISYAAATGKMGWVTSYDGPAHGGDVATALKVSPSGTQVYVTGYSDGVHAQEDTGYDYATIGYDALTGAALWTTRYNGPHDWNDLALAMAMRPDGRTVYVTGNSTKRNGLTESDYLTIAYHT